jgi:ppGpp synthetase/RelA/SpoT-type nucleotidyltranferase
VKVPLSIRDLHQQLTEQYQVLKVTVDDRLRRLKDSRWHYESRLKELESYAQKLETGRIEDPRRLEDFFACTLVVSNAKELERAIRLVKDEFVLKYRRPESSSETSKPPHSFAFDDLRLFVCLGTSPALPPKPEDELIFEVQIKTFLQHAWSIATHDLTYKTGDPNWSKARIAFQIKASLEHAELSIQEVEQLSKSASLQLEDEATREIRRCLSILSQNWDASKLPADVRRLAETVVHLFKQLQLDLADLQPLSDQMKARGGGTLPENLSPYATIVQALFEFKQTDIVRYIRSARKPFKILVPQEVPLPATINRSRCRNAVFV